MKNIYIINNGLKLSGTIFYPIGEKDKYPAALFVHGLTSDRERTFQYAEALAELGFVCLSLDLRGHGTSEGNINHFSNKDFLSDVVAAYDYLSEVEKVDSKNISAIGSSFGAYLIILLSSKRKIKNLSLRVPANYPDDAFEKPTVLNGGDNSDVMKWRNQPKGPKESHSLEALNKFDGSVLIIESGKDDRVPRQTILNYINAVKDKSKLKHVLMEDAPHSLKEGRFRNEVERVLTEWFKNKL